MSEDREANLPLVVGFGGIDAGGRWGGPNSPAFGSMIHAGGTLPPQVAVEQLRLMELVRKTGEDEYLYLPDETTKSAQELADEHSDLILDSLFVRKSNLDPAAGSPLRGFKASELVMEKADLPPDLPSGWEVEELGDGKVRVRSQAGVDLYAAARAPSRVTTTGCIPDGFRPHPEDVPGPARKKVARNLWLGLWAVNDAMKSAGLTFEEVRARIPQDQVGIYFGSAMGQVCPKGAFGYMASHVRGRRPESTHVAFSLNNTPAAFVAAYTAGSIGHISCDVGACATFMLNLHNAQRDIQSGRRRFAVVGAADAPVHPWVIRSYDVMKALAREADLPRDSQGEPIHRYASRPFGAGRHGFVIGEGAFAVLLADRELARDLGLPAHGLVVDVCCRSDGWKKSISSPGIGDYPALQQTLAAVTKRFGSDVLRHSSFVSAHGSSTPQNGATEARLYSEYARAFQIPAWRVSATKSFMGHSMGAAGGLQTISSLLALAQGVIPRIRNLSEVGVDPTIPAENLEFLAENYRFEPGTMKVAISLSKGFGGFNVAEALAGPQLASEYMLGEATPGERQAYEDARRERSERAAAFQEAYLGGAHLVDYDSSRPVTFEQIAISSPGSLEVEGYQPFSFDSID